MYAFFIMTSILYVGKVLKNQVQAQFTGGDLVR